MATILDWQRAYFRDQADPGLRKTWPVMAVLMTYADRELKCYPSQATIAKRAGIRDPETVRRHLKENETAGWLQRVSTGGPGKGTNRYRLVIPSPLHNGDIPATERGAIPAAQQPKLSTRTVHRTVHRTDHEGSPLQSGEPQSPDDKPSGGVSSSGYPKNSPALSPPHSGEGMPAGMVSLPQSVSGSDAMTRSPSSPTRRRPSRNYSLHWLPPTPGRSRRGRLGTLQGCRSR